MTMAAEGLAKLIEECGELLQVAGKKLAWWDTIEPHWDGTDLNQRMADEMGDVRAAIEFVSSMLGVHAQTEERYKWKHKLFCQWHADPTNNVHGIDGRPDPWDQDRFVAWAMDGPHHAAIMMDDPQPDESQGEVRVIFRNGSSVVYPARAQIDSWWQR